jgi:glycosyltransferase involved in cell wall biosynthesis
VTPRLSILICSLACRAEMLARLMARLSPQLTTDVEVIREIDNGEMTIGDKRNKLLDRATGDYVSMIDDDDLVADDYIPRILSALENNPDCVGFRSARYLNGERIGTCTYSLQSKRMIEQFDKDGQRQFVRTPGHLTPIKREHVLATRFMPWCTGEDRDMEKRILPRLKTESFIDAELYDYLLVSKENRVGEKAHARRWKPGWQRPMVPRRTGVANRSAVGVK